MDDLTRILSIEESQLNRNIEIDRVLECSDYDFFAIMEINPLFTTYEDIPNLIKKIYRKKSLLIHPDKSDHPEASKAFDKLKQSEKILGAIDEQSEEFKEKQRLYSIYQYFKKEDTPNELNHPENSQVRAKVAEIINNELADEELQKLAKQSEEIRKNEMYQKLKDEKNAKKQMENKWEENRDDRVKNWRNYSNKIDKRKKKKKDGKLKKLA